MVLNLSGDMGPLPEHAAAAGTYPSNTSNTGLEQLYTPLVIRRESNRSGGDALSGFEVQVSDGVSSGPFGGGHLGATRKELDPYFSTFATGSSNGWMQKCDYTIVRNDGNSTGGPDLNIKKVKRDTIETVAVSHFRGPMIVSGWGTDMGDRPVPYAGNVFLPDPNMVNDRGTWKSGPVDLKWDYQRKVWSMGHHMIAGVLEGSIVAPTTPCSPTYFTIKVFRSMDADIQTGNLQWALAESATITNRDISLQQEEVKDLVWVVAARINYEWVPVWVGCPDPCDDPETEEEEQCPQVPCAAGGTPPTPQPPNDEGGVAPNPGSILADPSWAGEFDAEGNPTYDDDFYLGFL